MAWLRQRIQGRTVYCQFIRKDQYGRVVSHFAASRCAVAHVLQVAVPLIPRSFLPVFFSKHLGSPLALEMLRAGVATTYTESGAEYGSWGRDKFLSVEEEAK